jgi:hypothetical protein
MLEYLLIAAAIVYLIEKGVFYTRQLITTHRHKALHKYHEEFEKISEDAKLRAELLWDDKARRLTQTYVEKCAANGTLPEPLLPFIDAAKACEGRVRHSFLSYAHGKLIAPHAQKYVDLAKKLQGDHVEDHLKEYQEQTNRAKETLRDAGFDIAQLDRQLAKL